MICRKCKKEVPDGAFCIECGTKQDIERNSRRRGKGEGSVYKRGKSWYACHTTYRNGKRILNKKGGFTTKKAALEWLAVPDKPTGPTITFKQLYDEWSPTHYPSITRKRELILINAFNSCPMLHDEYWRDIGVKEMQAAVDALDPEKYYPKKNLKALFAAMSEYAVIAGYADKTFAQYIKLPPEPVPEKTPFTEDEVQRLWNDYKAGNEFTGAILIMIYTGMRYGELVNVRPEDIHLDEGYMKGGIKTAAGKAGEILIIDEIKPLVKQLMMDEQLKEFSNVTFAKKFNKALARAGCGKHTPHECRHTTATLLAKKGVQPAIIQAIMRHTKYSQSAEYTHIDRQTKIDALNILKEQ